MFHLLWTRLRSYIGRGARGTKKAQGTFWRVFLVGFISLESRPTCPWKRGFWGLPPYLTAGAKWTVVPKRSVVLVCGRLPGDTGTLGCARDAAGLRRS